MKLIDSRQLDWQAVGRAADVIKHIASADAPYVPPEDLLMARTLIVRVCEQLNEITKALLITPPGATP